MITYRKYHLLVALMTLGALAVCLYWPYAQNGLIFDDQHLFGQGKIYDYAQVPFNFVPRTFPYFTLGFVKVLGGGMEINRAVSAFLHVLCAWTVYRLVYILLKQVSLGNEEKHASCIALLGAVWFLIHPIAVYGAGYLAQRTILFATLFSLLSLWFYQRAIFHNRISDTITAAGFYCLAVFSKEHAIMLPLVAVMLTALSAKGWWADRKKVLLYVALCAPATLAVLLSVKQVVATSYEPDVGTVILKMQDISIMSNPIGRWIVSIVMQAGFFFDYLAFWIIPDVGLLSADMRFDIVRIWSSWWIFPKAFLFFTSPIIAIYFLRKKGLLSLFCWGFLYCWILFLTELAAVRFQEPFVLYRTYLWAPGYVVMVAAICARVSLRWLVIIAIPVFVICFLLARDRLTSLASESSLWKDAAAKLASPTLIGSDRIFYNRGRAYLQEKKYTEAIEDFSRTIQMSPEIYHTYYNRALAFYAMKKDVEALRDLDSAMLLNQKDSSIQFVRGLLLERNGCTNAATLAYGASLALGNRIAQLKFDSLAKSPSEKHSHFSSSLKCPV